MLLSEYFITYQFINNDFSLVEETDILRAESPQEAIDKVRENYGEMKLAIKSIQKI